MEADPYMSIGHYSDEMAFASFKDSLEISNTCKL